MSAIKRAWATSWITLVLASTTSSVEFSFHPDAKVEPSESVANELQQPTQVQDRENQPSGAKLYLANTSVSGQNPQDLADVRVAWSVDKARNTCPVYTEDWETIVRDQLPQNMTDSAVKTDLSVRRQMAHLVSVAMEQSSSQAAPLIEVTDHDRAPLITPVSSELWHVWQQLYTSVAEVLNPEAENFYLWVNGKLVLQSPELTWVEYVAQTLEVALNDGAFDPNQVVPTQLNAQPAIRLGDRFVIPLDANHAIDEDENRELLAIEWTNNLRQALGVPELELVDAQIHMYGIADTEEAFSGTASWYGPYFHGRLTANGETYDQEAFTAAHQTLPFDTYLKVTNLENGESVILRINDRGPYIPPRTLDLSRGVARCLQSKDSGVVPYEAVIMTAS